MGLIHAIASHFRTGSRLAAAPGERRRSVRAAVHLPVMVTRYRGDPVTHCLAVDVSDGGMLVAPHLSGSVGERVMVAVDGRDGLVEAAIGGQRPVGTALVFTRPDDGVALAAWLDRRARGGSFPART